MPPRVVTTNGRKSLPMPMHDGGCREIKRKEAVFEEQEDDGGGAAVEAAKGLDETSDDGGARSEREHVRRHSKSEKVGRVSLSVSTQ